MRFNDALRIAATALMMLSVCASAGADEIHVEPGEGTISRALAGAGNGAVIVLKEGEYRDAVGLSAGFEMRGAGPDRTILIGTGFAAIRCLGPGVIVRDLQIRAEENSAMRRGVDSQTAVRIERCRFIDVPEAVALMRAPLSDVVHCHFEGCDIGVRAIGEASPTVWGCRFERGLLGVLSIGGSPYIRSNAFLDMGEGVRMVVGGSAMPIIRNNVFVSCEATGIIVLAEEQGIFAPSIRNNIFAASGAAMIGPAWSAQATSHCAVHKIPSPPWRDEEGNSTLDPADASNIELGDDIELGEDLLPRRAGEVILSDAGIRHGYEPEGATGPIGLAAETGAPGCLTPTDARLPEVRFKGPLHIVNGTSEEYHAMAMWGLRPSGQSLIMEDDGPRDVHRVGGDPQRTEVRFDISRFFGERWLGR